MPHYWSATTRSRRDSANRTERELLWPPFGNVRLITDAIYSFADGVLPRNDAEKNNKTTCDLIANLPGVIVGGFADKSTKLVEIPAQTAKKYSSAYQGGQKA